MVARWTNDEERRRSDHREHKVYRFDHPDGVYCYIGLTADLGQRIIDHCTRPDGPIYDFLSRYQTNPGDARKHFQILDRVAGFGRAEEKETEHILDALLESCDHTRPVPRNKKTHQIAPESFRKIATIAEYARAAQGIHENSRRADDAENRLKQCRVEQARAEGEKRTYQVLCVLLVLVLLALVAFGTG